MQPDSNDVSNKLIILYALLKIEIPVSYMQLMQIMLDNRFMNYFTFQEVTKELLDTKLISKSNHNLSHIYTITDVGIKSLNFFEGRIPPVIKKFIDNNVTSIKSKVLSDSFITADILEDNGEFIVNCKISENSFLLIDLKLTVGTRADAQLICNNWKKSPQKIYSEIINSLNQNSLINTKDFQEDT
jgi:predicted transcriptional regulator